MQMIRKMKKNSFLDLHQDLIFVKCASVLGNHNLERAKKYAGIAQW